MDRTISIKKLTPETEKDFLALKTDKSCGWCFCVAWHVPSWDGWDKRTAQENREFREELFRQGKHDGYILYENHAPVGFCQCAPLEWFPKLVSQRGLKDEPANTFVISCLEILPSHRKRGLSRVLLQAVLADLKTRDVPRVVAMPVEGSQPDGDIWTGPAAIFRANGFKIKKASDKYPLMELTLV